MAKKGNQNIDRITLTDRGMWDTQAVTMSAGVNSGGGVENPRAAFERIHCCKIWDQEISKSHRLTEGISRFRS